MKILGISGSPRKDHTTEKLVKEVLAGAEGVQTEFISLAGKKINPCIACLKCAGDNVCVVKDDMQPLRAKLLEADAIVFGGANFFQTLNGLAHCFLERWYQFRHREAMLLSGKLGVAVAVAGRDAEPVLNQIKTFFQYSQVETIAEVGANGVPGCFTCGYGEGCKVGAVVAMFGPDGKITEENTPSLDKQPDAIAAARAAGAQLADRLKKFAVGT